MFWTSLVTNVVRAPSYETIHLIDTVYAPIAYIHEVMNVFYVVFTHYRPRVSIIGSREQLCIHPEVKDLESNTAKVSILKYGYYNMKSRARQLLICHSIYIVIQ